MKKKKAGPRPLGCKGKILWDRYFESQAQALTVIAEVDLKNLSMNMELIAHRAADFADVMLSERAKRFS